MIMGERNDNRNDLLDIIRILAAILVVGIHSATYNSVEVDWFSGLFVNYFGRLAVPFFFMITGYYVIGTLDFSDKLWGQKIKKRLRRLTIVYIFWASFYFPLGIRGFLKDFDLKSIVKSVIVYPIGWGLDGTLLPLFFQFG